MTFMQIQLIWSVAAPCITCAALLPILLVQGSGAAADLGKSGEIPPAYLAAYIQAAGSSSCHLPWTLLAAIGKVESDHGRSGRPPGQGPGALIIGPALDGTNHTAVVPDTDGGRWDHDPVWDHAVGPMQILPSTWAAWAARARFQASGNEALPDPNNISDAATVAAAILCSAIPDGGGLRQAILSYNHSEAYADEVSAWMARYASLDPSVSGQTYTLPVPGDLVSDEILGRLHWDGLPAADIPVPIGTAIRAATRGRVGAITSDCDDPGACPCGNGLSVEGDDGYRYLYCHAEAVLAPPGSAVKTGERIALSGWSGDVIPKSPAGAHLHFQINGPSGPICPQPLLRAWLAGLQIPPGEAPPGPCGDGRPG